MLYYKFKNYEEFKELFGVTKHGNGVKSRKNKVLLTYLKNRDLLRSATKSGDYELLHISSMSELKQTILRRIESSGEGDDKLCYKVGLQNRTFYSSVYQTDNYKGICEDGDTKAVRYVNHDSNGKVFKMKSGKLVRALILETEFGRSLPEQVLIFLQEELSQDWQSYVMGVLPKSELNVDQNFSKIYDSDECRGDFGSCMTDKDYHSFYEDYVDASAAYLTDEEGVVIARAIIFNEVHDENDKVWRLAERQYSTDESNVLQRTLVDALIKGDYIDGYKQIGVGCGDNRAFVDTEGNSLSDSTFQIKCTLEYGCTLSYQDSFKWLDMGNQRAYNSQVNYDCVALDSADGEIEGDNNDEYDSYHEESVYEITTVYVRGQQESCDINNLTDFRLVNDDEWHHHEDVCTCPECDEYYVSNNGEYSELTDSDYCDSICLERADESYKESNWHFSIYDSEWYEDESSVVEYLNWDSHQERYQESTIHIDTLTDRLNSGKFYLIDEVYYNQIDTDRSLPFTHNNQVA